MGPILDYCLINFNNQNAPEIHRGLERQGPGDTDYSDYII